MDTTTTTTRSATTTSASVLPAGISLPVLELSSLVLAAQDKTNSDDAIALKTTTVSTVQHPHPVILFDNKRRRTVRFKMEESSPSKKSNNINNWIKKAAQKGQKYKTMLWAVSSKIRRKSGGEDKNDDTSSSSPLRRTYVSMLAQQQRKQRLILRQQMYTIVNMVQDYEITTHTKVPELLSQLLQRHSQPMVEEAICSALPATVDAIVF